VNNLAELREPLHDIAGRNASGNVIIAAEKHDQTRLVLKEYPIGEMVHVDNLRTPKAPIQWRMVAKPLRQIPPPNARAADEYHAPGRKRLLGILLFELLNGRFPLGDSILRKLVGN
jgi:hypothetical protein